MPANCKRARIISDSKYLRRPRIHDLLELSLQKPLTEIVAGAGYGKTHVVQDFLKESDVMPIWIQLSSLDNLSTRFWDNSIHSFSLISESLVSKLSAQGFPDSESKFYIFLSVFENEIKFAERFVLVYDDFHLITEKAILTFFQRFINAHNSKFSVILISRSQPKINTIGLLSKGMVSRINEDSLRLTKDEMGDIFHLHKITLTGKAISEFYSYTDGWIFAVNLVCLSLKKGVVYKQNPLTAVKLDIFKLLESEVFSGLQEEARNLLIRLSLVESLPLELLNVMSSGDTGLVQAVIGISSFIMFDCYSNTYRIHQLFLDFLREKQSILEPCEITEIHRMASEWYEKNSYKIDAIMHYEKIGYYNEIADILMTYTLRLPIETADFLMGVIDRMPDGLLEERPILSVLYAKYLINNFRIDEAYRRLFELKGKYEAMLLTETTKSVLGEVCVLLGFQSLITTTYTGELDFKEYFKIADSFLPLGSKLNTGLRLSAGNYTCTLMKSESGSFDRLLEAFEYTIPYLSRVLNGTGSGYDYIAKAEYAYFKRDLKYAEQNAYQAIARAQEKNQYDIENHAIFMLTRIATASGNYTKVMKFLAHQRLLAESADCAEVYTLHDICEGWFFATIGHTEKVEEWIKDELLSIEIMSPVTFAPDKLVRALCLLSENKIPELLAVIDKRAPGAAFEDQLLALIEMTVLKAVALYKAKEYDDSIKVLQEAFEMANPNSIIMPFIVMGKDMHTMVLTANNNENCSIPKDWLENIRKKSSAYAKNLSYIVSEYRKSNRVENGVRFNFTNRETQFLTDMCHGLTRDEIADNHNLSANTVKNALQIIYEKLGAENTKDAIRIATSMNLIH